MIRSNLKIKSIGISIKTYRKFSLKKKNFFYRIVFGDMLCTDIFLTNLTGPIKNQTLNWLNIYKYISFVLIMVLI